MIYKFKKTYFKDETHVNELIYLASEVKEKVEGYKIISSSLRTIENENDLPENVKKELETNDEVRIKYAIDEDTANKLIETYGEDLYKVNTEKFEKIEE